MSTLEEESSGSLAESVYRRWSGHERSPASFEALCAEHPDLADELRAIRRGEELAPRAGPGLAAPLPEGTPVLGGEEARYERLGELGRGGMGVVLRVRDARLERELALKLALTAEGREGSADELDPLRLRRFLDEARITARLSHPNIVPLHELGRDALGRPYFTMKLVEGRDLGQVFRLAREGREGWSVPRAVEALVRACEALVHAHERGIVHRDLKPANVMVGPLGEVYVMDWGLARELGREDARDLRLAEPAPGSEDSPLRTLDGHVLGTPVYMAPEQARGQLERIGPAADVYALGAMLYELLGARAPYADASGRTPARVALARVLAGPPRPLHELAAQAPPELVAVCARAMAREPAQRYASMRELAAELRAWLEGRVVRAHASGAWPELKKWVGRHRGAAAGAAASLVLLLLALVALRMSLASDALAAAEAEASALAKSRSYAFGLNAARIALETDDEALARALLDELPEDLRALEWRALARACAPRDPPLLAPGQGGRCALVFGAGRRLALPRNGSLEIHALDDPRAPPRSVAVDGRIVSLDAPLDGTRLALGVDGHRPLLLALDAREAAPLELAGEGEPPTRTSSVSLSPDGALLASAHLGPLVRLWSLAEERELPALETDSLQVMCVAWSPDGATLAVAARPHLLLLDPHARTPRAALEESPSDYALAWQPSGERLAAAGLDGRVRLWDPRTGELRARLQGHRGMVLALAWSADGSQLASGDDRGDVWRWYPDGRRSPRLLGNFGARVVGLAYLGEDALCVTGADGAVWRVPLAESEGLARTLGWHTGGPAGRAAAAALAFAPHGKVLASGGDDALIHLWALEGDEPARTLVGHADRIEQLLWCADGTRLVSASGDRTLRLWSAEGEPLAVLAGHVDEVTDVLALDQRTLLSCSRDGTLRRWTLEGCPPGGTVVADLGLPLQRLARSPEGTSVLVGDEDGTLVLLDARSWRERTRIALARKLSALAFADATQVVVAGYDGSVQLVALPGGARRDLRAAGPNGVQALVRAPRRLLLADGGLCFLDAEHGRELLRLSRLATQPTIALALAADQSRIALGTLTGEVLVLEADERP